MRLALATGLKPGLMRTNNIGRTQHRHSTPLTGLMTSKGWTSLPTDHRIDRLSPLQGKNKQLGSKNPEFNFPIEGSRYRPRTPTFSRRPSTTRRKSVGSTTLPTKSGSKRGEHRPGSGREAGPSARHQLPRGNSPGQHGSIFEPHGARREDAAHNRRWASNPRNRGRRRPHLDFLSPICRTPVSGFRRQTTFGQAWGFQYKSDEWEDAQACLQPASRHPTAKW
jgi:hypothetical protein